MTKKKSGRRDAENKSWTKKLNPVDCIAETWLKEQNKRTIEGGWIFCNNNIDI